jgi:hypothetical protein
MSWKNRNENNSTPYAHPNESNLWDLHKAMEYNAQGKPVVRVQGGTETYGVGISWADSPTITSFGRGRVSDSRILGEYRYMYGEGTLFEMNDLTSGTASITVDYPRVCALATIGTASGDRAVRQTKQYHPYISGTSNLFFITYVMDQAKENLVQAVGAFDDLNGIFFRMNGTVPEVVIRKNGTDTEIVSQNNWNMDRMDGSWESDPEGNPSHVNLDFSKAQILTLDYQWLGVGRVRIGFVVDGVVHHVHHFNHANSVTEVYMIQPSLPIRWEIKNVGDTSSSSELMMICGSVYCEGSDFETGWQRGVSTGSTTVSLTQANSQSYGKCAIALKLTNTQQGHPNRSLARLKGFNIITDVDIRYCIVLLPNSTTVFDGSPVWNDVPGAGWTQYTVNAALNSNWQSRPDYNILYDDFALGTKGNNNAVVGTADVVNRISTIYQNYDSTDSQCIAIICYYIGSNATIRASLSWLEVK